MVGREEGILMMVREGMGEWMFSSKEAKAFQAQEVPMFCDSPLSAISGAKHGDIKVHIASLQVAMHTEWAHKRARMAVFCQPPLRQVPRVPPSQFEFLDSRDAELLWVATQVMCCFSRPQRKKRYKISHTANESVPLNGTHHVGNVNERHG